MTENELRAKYVQAVRIIRSERKMREYVFRSDPIKLNAKLIEMDMLLSIVTEFKDELKAHLACPVGSAGAEQMALIDPPARYE
jgi:hypothetical protein